MSYTRKTKDEFHVQQYTGPEHKWESVCADETRKEARQTLKEYRENQPEYPARIKVVRVPLDK